MFKSMKCFQRRYRCIILGRDPVCSRRRVKNVLREILKDIIVFIRTIFSHCVYCVNITQINQCNLIRGKKGNVNIYIFFENESKNIMNLYLQIHTKESLLCMTKKKQILDTLEYTFFSD